MLASVPLLAAAPAMALTLRPATSDEGADLAAGCRADLGHAVSIELAVAQLRRGGVVFDEAVLRSSGRCPLCGCPVVGK
jgi:hypothetical protein